DITDVEAALELCRELSVPVLPRGAGSSQCGQTVGAALVIDTSKHLNRMLNFDPDNQSVEVEPGMVLDHLNARLRDRGLWFPVDVSTSAQATLGGMAGNNACGSRSLAYGNMVHNTEAIEVLLADGTVEWFGPFGVRGGERMKTARGGALVSRLFEIGQAHRDDIAQQFPKLLRRVGGYNLDVFHPQSIVECDYGGLALYLEKALTDDGESGLEADRSIEDVTLSLQGLSNGDGALAGQGYEALVTRWRKVAALEQAM
ncbi:MAG: FAD-binding oxidoreductase, partial [Betaproteobacteria bacterium]|nr:FAD-binding oxidoreductase [Betaproteobacteria bacterium]